MGSLKNTIFHFCFLILFIKFCSSYTYFTPSSVNRNYPGKCWSNETNRAYAPGESYQLYDKCEKIICQRDLSFKGFGYVFFFLFVDFVLIYF